MNWWLWMLAAWGALSIVSTAIVLAAFATNPREDEAPARVLIDLDVFGPGDKRAAKVTQGVGEDRQ